MISQSNKRLFVIDGAPATGKTRLARELAESLSIPLVSKDIFKERMFDTLGTGDREWSRRLGASSFEMMYLALEPALAGGSVVCETAFHREMSPRRLIEAAEKAGAEIVHVHLFCSTEEWYRRFKSRVESGERHPGHVDLTNAEFLEWEARFKAGEVDDYTNKAPMDLGALPIVIETTDLSRSFLDEVLNRARVSKSPSAKQQSVRR